MEESVIEASLKNVTYLREEGPSPAFKSNIPRFPESPENPFVGPGLYHIDQEVIRSTS